MKTRTFKIEAWGEMPAYVSKIVDKFKGQAVTLDSVYNLDQDISFVVRSIRICDGNLNKSDKSAWMCPVGGNGNWNVRISF